MVKHAVAGRFAAIAAVMVSLSASAVTQTLVEGDSLADAVTAAKADYEANGTPQEIVLGKGTYELTAPQKIQFPLVVCGATGNPDDVTVDGNQKTQLFQLDHADAAILNVTLKGGFVTSSSGEFTPCRGAGVNIERLHGSGSGQEAWRQFTDGAGGTVSNCVFTGCKAYGKSGSGAAFACLSPNGLVTHCRIIGNTATRQSDSPEGSAFVNLTRGTLRNTIIVGNSEVKMAGDSRADKYGYAVEVGTAQMINCTIVGNKMFGDYTAVINAASSAKIVNTAVADNTLQTVEDHSSQWKGAAAAFVNCVTDWESAPNETCSISTLEGMKFLEVAVWDVRPLSGSSLLGTGTTDPTYDYGTTDFYGKPRFRDATIDVGAAQFDAGTYVLECSVTPDAKLYAPRTATLAVVKALGFGDAPVFYWDFDGDDKTDLVTTEPSVMQPFGAGVHPISVCVSNDVATFGAKYLFAEPFEVLAQPVRYVKAGNAGKEPYDSEANAAGDIQTAINFCGEEEKIVVLKGIYNTTMAVDVNKKLEVIGATGNPEDVIIHNTVSGYRCLKVTKAGAFVASMALENGKPDWDHDHNTSTRGTGAYLTAGTVSNLVVRNCTEPSAKNSRGAAIDAIGANVFVTHCVISNNVSNAGAKDGFFLGANGLSLENGAKAENCLIADNRGVHTATDAWNGWGQVAVFVGNGSRMRFCTVAGNTTLLFGAVGVYGTGTFEDCIVAGNKMLEPNLDNSVRHATWCAFDPSVGHYVGPSTDVTKPNIYDAAQQTAEAEYAAGIAANQVYNAVDNEAHGLGATTVLAATDRLVRNLAKKDWQLPKGSPAIDKVPVEAAADMATLDVSGNKRLFGGIYDIGCHERLVKGLMILLR